MAEENLKTNVPEEEYREMTAEELISVMKGEMADDPRYRQFYHIRDWGNSVVIDNVRVIDDILILEGMIFPLPIFISGGEFQGFFNIDGGLFQGNLYFNGGVFQRYFAIDSGEFEGNFVINAGEFQGSFNICGGTFIGDIIINNGEFQGSFYLSKGEFQGSFSISGGEFQRPFEIFGGSFNNLTFGNGHFSSILISSFKVSVDTLNINNDGFTRLILRGCQIRHLVFKGMMKQPSSIEMLDLQLEWLELTGFFNLSHFFLTNISVLPNKSPTLVISHSHIGFFECKKVNFKRFKNVHIVKSNLTGLKLYDSDFPIYKQANRGLVTQLRANPSPVPFRVTSWSDSNTREYFQDVYEIYRDLTKAVDNQKDVRQRLLYFSASQRALYRSKSWWPPNEFGSKISLFISWLISNYGQSWLRAILFTAGTAAGFFSLYLICLKTPGGATFNLDTWAYYFQFLNPTHRFNFMTDLGVEPGFYASMIDFISRIFIALGAFEVVRAFRKYVRR